MKRLHVLVLAALVAASPLSAHAAGTAASTKAAPAPTAAKAAPTAAAKATPAPMAAPAASGAKLAPDAKVDLNTASKEELMKLPGIGEAIAAKIVAGRPFKAKNELLTRGLVNRAQYAKLAPNVIAKQPGGAR